MADKQYEILTLRKDTAGSAGHWQQSKTSPYGSRENETIVESNSSNTTEPTSIPSPFARMELARTAFGIAAEILNRPNNTWQDVPRRYQKIVSDCLDVAEIFFNYPMYSKFVEIIKWDRSDLYKMKDTELGKAMIKFMDSNAGDNKTYHFNKMDAIYLLNYTGANRPNRTGLNIIGATSPITLYFSVDNDLSYVGENIHFTNGDKPFDGDFNPLEKRDINFVRYMNLFRNEYNKADFAKDFKAVSDYIEAACNRLPSSAKLDGQYDYQVITTKTGDIIQVLGKNIGCQSAKAPRQSDFEINSTICSEKLLPLVLPTEASNAYAKCAYIEDGDTWGNINHAPLIETVALDERVLPGTNVKYPYLTLSDFFEENIIQMPYKLNVDAFFDGNFDKLPEVSYLLPLKKSFFKFFTVEELSKMISINSSGTVITVKLRIPIKNYSKRSQRAFIEYTKTYQSNPNIATSIGGIVEGVKFGLGVFPIVKTQTEKLANYRVALYDKVGDAQLRFYNGLEEVTPTYTPTKPHRDFDRNSMLCSVTSCVISHTNFDRIAVEIAGAKGYVIPKFIDGGGSQEFHFAVDFGTTNTHIAYSIKNVKESTAFDCQKPQMARLHDNYKQDKDITAAFEDNFVPAIIGNDKVTFPIRSAFAEDQHINYNNRTYTLCDGNIPFRYEKIGSIEYLDIKTDEELKWSANSGRIRLYIRNIAYMIRNKVLLENGRLDRTEIRWFYPASMSYAIRGMMEKAWFEAYQDYFDEAFNEDSGKVTCMSESIAPFCHYMNKGQATGIVTTIDIGGGTTDVYISDGKKNADGTMKDGCLMSFRCASNAIFGDGYNNNINSNGFVQKYSSVFRAALSDDASLTHTLDTIKQKGHSADLISFFFSLASTGKPGLNFMDKLVADQQLKYVFLIFYSAIIYHVAQTMKAKGYDMPQTVAFSGNGSKTLQVISQLKTTQTEFVQTIFEKVYGQQYPSTVKFSLKFDADKPKEATANGGLEATEEQIKAKPELIVLLGVDNKRFIDQETYDKISESTKKSIVNNVLDFIKFVPTLNVNNSFGDKYNLDVNILDQVLQICKQNLDSYLDYGLEKVLKLLSQDATRTKDVTESLFFYPIVGMLNNLAKEIYETHND